MQLRVRVFLDEAGRFQAGDSADMAALVTHGTSLSAGNVRAVVQPMRDKYGTDFKADQVDRLDMVRLAVLIRAKGWLVFRHQLLPSEPVAITEIMRDALTRLERERRNARANHPLLNMDFRVLDVLKRPVSESTDRWFSLLWLLMKDRNREARCCLGDWMIDRRSDINEAVVQHLLMLNFLAFAPRAEIDEILRRVRVKGIADFYRVTSGAAEEEGCEGLAIADFCAMFSRQANVQYRTTTDTAGFQLFCDILNTPNMDGAILPADTDIPCWVEECARIWEHFAKEGLESVKQRFSANSQRVRIAWMTSNGFLRNHPTTGR